MTPLLNIDDIAALWGVTRRHARDILVKTPGFPQEAPGSSVRQKRWAKDDVYAYIHRKPAQNPREIPNAT